MSMLAIGRFRAIVGAALLLVALGADAQTPVVSKVMEACKVEVEVFCDKITPGNGRVLACLYANEDQLSPTCGFNLYQGAGELQKLMGEMNRVAIACKADMETLCGAMSKRASRIGQCLRLQQRALSAPCRDAIEATGIDLK